MKNLGWGITQVDTRLYRPQLAACYLMQEGDRATIIETGTSQAVDIILNALKTQGIGLEQVDYVIPTHVHLDHAGGVGKLMQLLPKAKLVIHPRGARHMVDPGKLQAGATEVYGEQVYQAIYGDLIPVDQQLVIEASDNFKLDLGGRELCFLDTPGHASHHFCIYDINSAGIFSGDTFGLAYPEFTCNSRPFLLPSASPVQFNPQTLKHSIERLIALKPKRIFLTHYGEITDPAVHVSSLLEQIDDYVAIAKRLEPVENRQVQLLSALTEYTLQRIADHGVTLGESKSQELLAMDLDLNAQGLDVWLTKQAKQAKQ